MCCAAWCQRLLGYIRSSLPSCCVPALSGSAGRSGRTPCAWARFLQRLCCVADCCAACCSQLCTHVQAFGGEKKESVDAPAK